MARCRSPKPCYNKVCKCKSSYNGQSDSLTSEATYYIVAIDTLIDSEAYDNSVYPGLKAYSIIKIDENGAFEVDRTYRSIKEALEAWPNAVPPSS